MSTRLEDSNTSREISLSRYFRRYTEKEDLLVLVEGEEDIPFWSMLLGRKSEHYARIDVTNLKVRDAESGEEQTYKGKDSLMKLTGLGRSKCIAVDRDYDSLVPGYHSYSSRIGSDPYILYTRFYAMENHKLHPEVIGDFFSDMLHKDVAIDFRSILGQLSLAIADFVLLLIVYERRCAQPGNPERCLREITIGKLYSQILAKPFRFNNYEADFQDLGESLQTTFGTLLERYRSEVEALREELSVCHQKREEDYWKLLQGHTLYGVMKKLFQGVLLMKKREEEQNIRKQFVGEKLAEAISAYNHTLGWSSTNILSKIDETFTLHPHIAANDWEEHFEGMIEKIRENQET